MRIAVIGAGYVGLVAAACFAELGHRVVCVDNNQAKIAALNSSRPPIYEEFLAELLARYHGSELTFTASLANGAKDAQVIFIAVGTPMLSSGEADLSYVESVTSEIARFIRAPTVIVAKSTVPVGTSAWIERCLVLNGCDRDNSLS